MADFLLDVEKPTKKPNPPVPNFNREGENSRFLSKAGQTNESEIFQIKVKSKLVMAIRVQRK
ncbi:hypothetical protein SD81_018390 [Tolypothrix campylonemoides VB511288]|nr:hypothetical protein SD81_018390 [Tolypothrix campylonemoides VB511288]